MAELREDPRLALAKARPITEIAERLGAMSGLRRVSHEWIGACPVCGGGARADRFSINPAKGVFNCRRCGVGGDGIKLVQHVLACDFKAALSWLEGDAAIELSHEERRAREEKAHREAEARAADQERYRRRAIEDAQRIWRAARHEDGGLVRAYLAARGISPEMLPELPVALRFIADHPCVKQVGGKRQVLHRGPAMIAGILAPSGALTAVHQTWIDPEPPHGKARIVHGGEAFPAKMVRGSKKGGAIRLTGPARPATLVMGEGIETTLSAAGAWADALPGAGFWAGVDLGNMAGRMFYVDPETGKRRRNSGLPDMADAEAFVPPPCVRRLIFIQDGDSDYAATRAKLLSGLRRAMARVPGLKGQIVMAGPGVDLNDVLNGKGVDHDDAED